MRAAGSWGSLEHLHLRVWKKSVLVTQNLGLEGSCWTQSSLALLAVD